MSIGRAYRMGPKIYRKEYWSGLPFPSPGDLPNPGIESRSPTQQADSLPSELPGKPTKTAGYRGNVFRLFIWSLKVFVTLKYHLDNNSKEMTIT